MYPIDGPDTFWLDFTNIALGLVTLVCVLLIAGGVVQELLHRRRAAAVEGDDHAFASPDLGVTMADGGTRVDGAPRTRRLS
jgi:hypothetical protein